MFGLLADMKEAEMREKRAKELAEADTMPKWCMNCGNLCEEDHEHCPECGQNRVELYEMLQILMGVKSDTG